MELLFYYEGEVGGVCDFKFFKVGLKGLIWTFKLIFAQVGACLAVEVLFIFILFRF